MSTNELYTLTVSTVSSRGVKSKSFEYDDIRPGLLNMLFNQGEYKV